MNRKLTTGTPSLHPISVKTTWYQIGIDFIGPLSPTADDGSKYILTVSDYFSKWVEAVPTPDKTASTVASALFKVSGVCVCLQHHWPWHALLSLEQDYSYTCLLEIMQTDVH